MCAVLMLADAALAAVHVAPAAELALVNGGFETGALNGWSQCGGIRVADRLAGGPPGFASDNQKALKLAPTSDGPGCTFYFSEAAKFWQPLDIPATAEKVIVTFWHFNQQVVAAPQLAPPAVAVTLQPRVDATLDQVFLGSLDANLAPGWSLASFELAPARMVDVRGKRMFLTFSLGVSLFDSPPIFYIDQVRVHTTTPQFTVPKTTMPVALQADRTGPIAAIQISGEARNVLRMNADGSEARTLYTTVNFSVTGATGVMWSPDGRRLAVSEDALQDDPVEFQSDRARTSRLQTMSPNGQDRREVFRTLGQPIAPGLPRGCRYPRTDCTREEVNALDVLIRNWRWSPDGRQLLTNRCVNQRWSFGFTDDPTCRLILRNAVTGVEAGDIGPLNSLPDWGESGLIYAIFNEGMRNGIYRWRPEQPALAPTLMVSHYHQVLPTDVSPMWLGNTQQFISLRLMDAIWYDGNGVAGPLRYAVMKFDVQDASSPTMLLYLDHVRQVFGWDTSPNARYALYTAADHTGLVDVWWLDLANGDTGRITTGAGVHRISWRRNTPADTAMRAFLPVLSK